MGRAVAAAARKEEEKEGKEGGTARRWSSTMAGGEPLADTADPPPSPASPMVHTISHTPPFPPILRYRNFVSGEFIFDFPSFVALFSRCLPNEILVALFGVCNR